jgi:hypothetical protein
MFRNRHTATRDETITELDKTQAEFNAALKTLQQSIDNFTACVDKYTWRRHSKCFESGMAVTLTNDEARAGVIEEERDQLASQLFALNQRDLPPVEAKAQIDDELVRIQAMHENCKQVVDINKSAIQLLRRHRPLFLMFSNYSATMSKANGVLENQLKKCIKIERTRDALEAKQAFYKV